MADTNLLILAREFKALRNRVQEVLKMPVGPQGLQGEKGEQGVKGDMGAPGKDGKDGKDGVNGLNGANGTNGVDGTDGKDGLDGVGVQNAYIDFDNSLVIVLTSGQEINAGFLSQETKEAVVATFKQGAATLNELLPVQTGNAGKFLTTDGENTSWATVSAGGSYTNADVDAHLNTSTATTNQVLGWSGTDYDWVTVSAGGGGLATVLDEGITLTNTATSLNFTGVGVTASASGDAVTVNIASTGGGVTVSATPPTSPTGGAQWLDTRSGALFTWYVGPTSSAWVSAAPTSPSIPPTFVSQEKAQGSSISVMPSHVAGDLLVMFAYRNNSASGVTPPAGWTSVNTASGTTNSAGIFTKVAKSSTETSGTWTNATELNLLVYRNAALVGASARQTGSGTSITYPGLTLQASDGSSIVAAFAGHRSTNTSIATPPTGTTLRSNTTRTAGFDTNGVVTSWTAQSVSVGGSSSGWCSFAVQIIGFSAYTNSVATLDFPTATYVGQKYVQSGNTFVWNGTAWLYIQEPGIGRKQQYVYLPGKLSSVSYQNTTGRPITVFIRGISGYASLYVSKTIPSSWGASEQVSETMIVVNPSTFQPFSSQNGCMMAIVPEGYYYYAQLSGSFIWTELQ